MYRLPFSTRCPIQCTLISKLALFLQDCPLTNPCHSRTFGCEPAVEWDALIVEKQEQLRPSAVSRCWFATMRCWHYHHKQKQGHIQDLGQKEQLQKLRWSQTTGIFKALPQTIQVSDADIAEAQKRCHAKLVVKSSCHLWMVNKTEN